MLKWRVGCSVEGGEVSEAVGRLDSERAAVEKAREWASSSALRRLMSFGVQLDLLVGSCLESVLVTYISLRA